MGFLLQNDEQHAIGFGFCWEKELLLKKKLEGGERELEGLGEGNPEGRQEESISFSHTIFLK